MGVEDLAVGQAGRILIVDRKSRIRQETAAALRGLDYHVDEVDNGDQARALLNKSSYQLLLAEVSQLAGCGFEFLLGQEAILSSTVVVLMAAASSVDDVAAVMRAGAADFIQRPYGLDELCLRLEKALKVRFYEHELTYLRHERNIIYRFENFIGESPAIKQVFALLGRVANSNASILISGETGTGKELVAGAIHYSSPRAAKSFIKVNCAALHDNLLESELFGHEKGAYTGASRQRIGRFEQADRGTLFLDEIGDMSLATQAKLLRVLQEKEFERLGGDKTIKVDARIISASNKDLAKIIREGDFREDLFYRINVINVHLPPLRERREDIPLLAESFIRKFAADLKKNTATLHPEAARFLQQHHWPGNVRELQNCIERAVLMSDGSEIVKSDLLFLKGICQEGEDEPDPLFAIPLQGLKLEEMERSLIVETLKACNWVQKDAAVMLGISKRVMNYKVKQLGLANARWLKNR
ncbi:MAG: sigma-54-dependent Fis family transcriptional regulator [Deltaproteobacteria bacterium]|nr:sigma-54-dependent Fis family transcriptional regulator [Deltaproteobacteria bacterium]